MTFDIIYWIHQWRNPIRWNFAFLKIPNGRNGCQRDDRNFPTGSQVYDDNSGGGWHRTRQMAPWHYFFFLLSPSPRGRSLRSQSKGAEMFSWRIRPPGRSRLQRTFQWKRGEEAVTRWNETTELSVLVGVFVRGRSLVNEALRSDRRDFKNQTLTRNKSRGGKIFSTNWWILTVENDRKSIKFGFN